MTDTSVTNKSGDKPATDGSDSGTVELEANREQKRTDPSSSEIVESQFAPTELIEIPEANIGVYEHEWGSHKVPCCSGRGNETASSRGYNAERLASTVLGGGSLFTKYSPAEPYIDTYTGGSHGVGLYIESKSCVNRYPSGSYGRFKFWRHHHDDLVEDAEWYTIPEALHVYFFVVYEVIDERALEVGKLVVPVDQIDDILYEWTLENHETMGRAYSRDMSWNLLLKRLEVPKEVFLDQQVVDLTDGPPTKSSDS